MPQSSTNNSTPPTPPIEETAFREVLRVTGLLKRVTEPHFARFGISGAQWGILRTLHRRAAEGGEALRVTDLSDRLLIRPPSISGVVDRLERMRLVIKLPAAGDLRYRHIRLTEAGERLVAQVLANHSEWIASIMNGLSAAEHQELLRLMRAWGAHLSPLADGAENGAPPAARAGERSGTGS